MLRRTAIDSIRCRKAAFTLAELLIAVLFLGILAAVTLPRMRTDFFDRSKSKALAQKMITDLRLARTMAITNAASNTAGFALQMTGTSPYHSYDIINLATDEVIFSHTIDNKVTCSGGSLFKFGPMGNLLAGSDTQLAFSAAGKTSTISLTPATGAAMCGEN